MSHCGLRFVFYWEGAVFCVVLRTAGGIHFIILQLWLLSSTFLSLPALCLDVNFKERALLVLCTTEGLAYFWPSLNVNINKSIVKNDCTRGK